MDNPEADAMVKELQQHMANHEHNLPFEDLGSSAKASINDRIYTLYKLIVEDEYEDPEFVKFTVGRMKERLGL